MWVRDPKVAAPSSRSPPFLLLLFLSLAVSSTTFRPTFHARFAGSFCTFVVRPDACVPVQSRAATPSLSFSSMAVPRLLRQNVFQYFFFSKNNIPPRILRLSYSRIFSRNSFSNHESILSFPEINSGARVEYSAEQYFWKRRNFDERSLRME